MGLPAFSNAGSLVLYSGKALVLLQHYIKYKDIIRIKVTIRLFSSNAVGFLRKNAYLYK